MYVRELLFGNSGRHTRMNEETSRSGDGVSLSMGTLLGNMEGPPLPGTLERK